jgi:hypothetical protein
VNTRQRHADRYPLGAAVLSGAVFPAVSATLAPAAHADASGTYLNCLTANGLVITNAANAINLGRRIQIDEMNNLPRNQIIRNLVNGWGADPYMANVYVDCAYRTLTSSNV